MPSEILIAVITVGGAQFGAYLISRQNVNDLRVNIDREVDIIRKLQPDAEEAAQLETHVRASVAKLISRDERRERLFDVIWRYAPLILVSSAVLGLEAWRRHGVPAALGLPVAIVYYALYAITGWLLGRYVVGLLTLAYAYSRLSALRVKRWWLKRRVAKERERANAVLAVAEDLLDTLEVAAAEEASGDKEQAQITMRNAVEEMVQRLAGMGLQMKSHPVKRRCRVRRW